MSTAPALDSICRYFTLDPSYVLIARVLLLFFRRFRVKFASQAMGVLTEMGCHPQALVESDVDGQWKAHTEHNESIELTETYATTFSRTI